MEAVACLDEFMQDAGRAKLEQGGLEFRHHVAATNLAEIAAVLAGRAVGKLRRKLGESIRLGQKRVQRFFGPRPDLRHIHLRRYLEQYVPRMDEVAAFELGRV